MSLFLNYKYANKALIVTHDDVWLAAVEMEPVSSPDTPLRFYTFMPRSSTTSILCCQTHRGSLELLVFKAALCFKQSAVRHNGCSHIPSEQFCTVGKATIWQWLPLSGSFLEWKLCTNIIRTTVILLCITHKHILLLYHTSDLFHHLPSCCSNSATHLS